VVPRGAARASLAGRAVGVETGNVLTPVDDPDGFDPVTGGCHSGRSSAKIYKAETVDRGGAKAAGESGGK